MRQRQSDEKVSRGIFRSDWIYTLKMIIELSSQSFQTVSPLFAGIEHNIALVHAVIDGSSRGRIFADDAASPTCALIAMEGAFLYLGGAPASEDDAQALFACIFTDLLSNAQEKELVLFAYNDLGRAQMEPLLAERGAITIYRKIFAFNPQKFASLVSWRAHIPMGMQLRMIDAEIAGLYPQFQPLIDPSTRRLGVCLIENGRILSHCTSVAVGGGEAEVDIFTEEDCRGRGLAAITAVAFIEECQKRGLTPAWACWPYREGSYKLAKKLGFEECPDAPAFYWTEGMG